jgi:hypothetical protein
MRVKEFAKVIGLTPQALLTRVRRDLPRLRLDSVMTQLLDNEVDAIIKALVTERPRHDLSNTLYAEEARAAFAAYASMRTLRGEVKPGSTLREPASSRASALHIPKFNHLNTEPEPRFKEFMQFVDALHHISATTSQSAGRELLAHDKYSCRLCAEEGEFAAVMARRRAAVAGLGQSFRGYCTELIEDVALLEFDMTTHEALQRADPDTLTRLQSKLEVLYPMDIEWDYVYDYMLANLKKGSPRVTTDLTRGQVRYMLTSVDNINDELDIARGYGEIDDAQFARIEPWLAGDGVVDYPWFRGLMDEDYLTYSAALVFELRRAYRVMTDVALEHVFGEGEYATLLNFSDEYGETRYHFFMCVGQGGAASVVQSFRL